MTRGASKSGARVAASKGVAFTKSPVLAVRLPDWRSRMVLFVLFASFAALGARAVWLQGLSTQFLQKQGEIRYARTIELPATPPTMAPPAVPTPLWPRSMVTGRTPSIVP